MVRKERKRKLHDEKELQKLYGDAYKKEVKEFQSDFPKNIIKSEYKKLLQHDTFGNQRILSNKVWKQSYVMAVGEVNKILCIPLSVVEKAIQ